MIKKVKKLVKDFGLGELRTGLKVTGKEFVNKNITVQFPEERTPISPRFRGLACPSTLPKWRREMHRLQAL